MNIDNENSPASSQADGPRFIAADALYTANETAYYLRVSKRTLERWRTDGRGPRVTRLWPGARPLYLGGDIINALKRSGSAYDEIR